MQVAERAKHTRRKKRLPVQPLEGLLAERGRGIGIESGHAELSGGVTQQVRAPQVADVEQCGGAREKPGCGARIASTGGASAGRGEPFRGLVGKRVPPLVDRRELRPE